MNKKKAPHDHGEHLDSIINSIPKDKDFYNVAEIFKQLNDLSRLKIFFILCHVEECVTNISYITNMTSPAVSHHLKSLKNCSLIISKRKGKEVYYKAALSKKAQSLHHMIENLIKITCPSE
ncbi:MAG: metalloregulator ArsR/SmtB family transcription factor [Eubacteriales bacterium]|nr:metalloregulator ArsR/SmtB family transcription factor [Eubacteriales bacterium]